MMNKSNKKRPICVRQRQTVARQTLDFKSWRKLYFTEKISTELHFKPNFFFLFFSFGDK